MHRVFSTLHLRAIERDAWVALTLRAPHITSSTLLHELIWWSCICWLHLLCACVFHVLCFLFFSVHRREKRAKVNNWNLWHARCESNCLCRIMWCTASSLHKDGTPVSSSYQPNTSTAASARLYPYTSMGLLHLRVKDHVRSVFRSIIHVYILNKQYWI